MPQEHLKSSDFYKHALICTCIHMCITCAFTRVCALMCRHLHMHTLTCACTHMCTYSRVHALTCDTHVHTHMHILTYTHIPKSSGLVGPNGPWSCDSQEPSSLCYSACYRVENAVLDSAPAGPLSQTCLITHQPEETMSSRPPWALNCSIDNHLTDLESQEVGAGVPQLSQKHKACLLPHPS